MNKDVPEGWLLCDGQNGTPNLKNRFIYGGNNIGVKGGSETVTLSKDEIPSHNHSNWNSVTSYSDSHSHRYNRSGNPKVSSSNFGYRGYNKGCGQRMANAFKYSGSSQTLFTSDSEAKHKHTITISNQGGGKPHNNMPPYIVLAFIIKK